MKLYYTPGACSLGAHIALEWVGEKYEADPIPFADEKLKELYPEAAGKVPIFDRGTGTPALTQTPAVLRYIADRFSKADISGGTSLDDAAEVNRWLAFLSADLHPACHPLFVGERYTTQTSDEALLAVRDAAKNLAQRELDVLNRHMDGRTYIVGDKPSIVDAYAYPMLGWILMKFPEGLGNYPNLQRLRNTMSEDAGVDAAERMEGLK